jgi:Fic family protein
MYDLMKWLNKEISEKKSHPLIISSLFHYKFVRIHPFDDGNGRMSRLLMNLILMKFGLPPVIIPYEIKDNYYNALQFADAVDIDKFIIFIGERLIEALNLVLKVGKNEPVEREYSPEELMILIKNKL